MTSPSQLQGYTYRFEAGTDTSGPVLLLLHGTGGDENDLIPFGRLIAPEAHLISPRGNVSEHGANRFFRRLAEGVFDLKDLAERTAQMGRFVADAAAAHGFSTDRVVAVGFSNGANIAASVMLSAPTVLRHGILIRAMVPFEPQTPPDLSRSTALLAAGKADQMVKPENTERLAGMMRGYGARVELKWQPAGHGLVQEDVADARSYLAAWRLATR